MKKKNGIYIVFILCVLTLLLVAAGSAVKGNSSEQAIWKANNVSAMNIPLNLVRVNLSISGIVFNDQNGTGLRTKDHPGIPGWTIILKRDRKQDLQTTTDEAGRYSFQNLDPGDYTVSENIMAGWTQTYPGSGCYNITLLDKDANGYNFGNHFGSVAYVAHVLTKHPIMSKRAWIMRSQEVKKLSKVVSSKESNLSKLQLGFSYPTSFSLLSHVPYNSIERDQGICGNCWVWACTANIEVAHDIQNGVLDRLSIQFLDSNYNGGTGSWACCGGWEYDFADFYSTQGMFIPWSNANANFQDGNSYCTNSTSVPSSSISTIQNYPTTSIQWNLIATKDIGPDEAINNIKAILNQNKAVTLGFYLPDFIPFWSFWDSSSDVWIPDPYCGIPDGTYPGGHEVTIVGYDDTNPSKRYWIALNSWGITTAHPDGTYKIKMDMNYSCSNDGWYSYDFGYFDVTFGENTHLYYPDFTDTTSPDSWRSWLVMQNPTDSTANINLDIRSRSGDMLFIGSSSIPPRAVRAIRPRDLIGSDCAGSAVVSSDQPIIGSCQITRNSNEMCMSYNALDQGSTTLYYPDFTDNIDPDGWRSWLVIQNPTASAAGITLDIRSRGGDLLYSGYQTIPAHGVNAIRPRNLVGADCAGSAVITSDQPIMGTCQITRNNNKMCMSYNAFDHGATALYYPDFTDSSDANSWRSWLVLQNPGTSPAYLTYEIRSRAGDVLYTGNDIIPPHSVNAVRPRNLAGSDCAGSAVVTSDQPIMGTCQITRNSNEMCMSYNALDQGSATLYYPDFTDTADANSWRSWLVLQNPSASAANITLEIRSRAGDLLYSGSQVIPAHGVNAIRPRNLVGSDCAGSVVVTSGQPIIGTCQINRNNNLMCMSYSATA